LSRIERQTVNQQLAMIADDAFSALHFHVLNIEDLGRRGREESRAVTTSGPVSFPLVPYS